MRHKSTHFKTQIDLEDYLKTPAEQARDEGRERVKKSNDEWFGDAMKVIAGMPSDFVGIGEDVRHYVANRIGPPKKPQAWGSLISHAVRKNMLRETGELRKMRDLKSHARRSMVLAKGTGQ
jgi:hypothetical protein